MEDLALRIKSAKADRREMDRLVRDYIPFIKSEISKVSAAGLEYDDKMSLGMLVFVGCVGQYQSSRGAFISYAAVCIRNRLLDEVRKIKRQNEKLIFIDRESADSESALEGTAAAAAYNRELERSYLSQEILALSALLKDHDITFGELARAGPKQQRSRELCQNAARAVFADQTLYDAFLKTKKLPQAALAARVGVSTKTLEKHRRYIVALLLILSGDYPAIQSYIPLGEEVL